jgi:hypothetical protein
VRCTSTTPYLPEGSPELGTERQSGNVEWKQSDARSKS